jgi:hemerythrin-like domain-containing protein
MTRPTNRREFLHESGTLSTAVLGGLVSTLPALGQNKKEEPEEVSPAEDLMREHGLLNRLLLIYQEHLRLISARQPFDPQVLSDAAGIIRKFVEDYHEKLEENYLFPRFRKAGRLVELVGTLEQQHEAGRRLTATVQKLAVPSTVKNEDRLRDLSQTLESFLRMYRPHEAREDTVLFPEFKKIVSSHEYASLGDDFEKKEDELFGDDGFFKVVDQVAVLEKKLGIYNLDQFTPK